MKTLFTFACAALCVGLQAPSFAEETLYQVEMIVFERTGQARQNDNETWPKILDMRYPSDWVRLISQEDAAGMADIQALDKDTEFSLSNEFLSSIGNAVKDQYHQDAQAMTQANDLEALPSYRFLPNSAQTLRPESRALDRRGQYRTLFHEAWLQPLSSGRSEPALVLRGGDLYEDHHELEGFIKISLNRYLHIETNLWFSQFVPNYGQLSDHWPALPRFPGTALTSGDLLKTEVKLGEANDSGFRLSTYEGADSLYTDSPFDTGFSTSASASEENEGAYLIKETITHTQKRRMRSRELHYLDHPRLGVLIRITPWEPEKTAES